MCLSVRDFYPVSLESERSGVCVAGGRAFSPEAESRLLDDFTPVYYIIVNRELPLSTYTIVNSAVSHSASYGLGAAALSTIYSH